jgi:mutator protein MutT
MTQPIRETARGVILRGNNLLLLRRTRKNNEGTIDNWLSIPGGGLDPGETPEQAIVRELQEELGVTVKIDSFLAKQDVPTDESRHYYFLCSILDGEPRIQEQSEEYERMQSEIPNTYTIEWTDMADPKLPNDLFWAYARAYAKFAPFLHFGLDKPFTLLTADISAHEAATI